MSLEDIIIASKLFSGEELSLLQMILIKIGIPTLYMVGLIILGLILYFAWYGICDIVDKLKKKKKSNHK